VSRCSVNFSNISWSSGAVSVSFSTPGPSCSFSLITGEPTRPTPCNPDQGGFTCRVTGLSPGTRYQVMVISEQDGESGSTTVRTAPLPVQKLMVRHADETTLSVLWSPPPGEWDGFTVFLRQADPHRMDPALQQADPHQMDPSLPQVAPALPQEAPTLPQVAPAPMEVWRALPREAKEFTFTTLTSGEQYTITVMTNSGNLSSSASVRAYTRPAQVSGLLLGVQSSTDSLQASWQRASGVLDSYRVLLVSDSSVIKNESVAADATSTSFHLLRPGALYRAVLTTVRAGLSSRQTVAEGHT
ncbi:receptor-type tyrosine-protein phosphatase beta-like, partial [Notothenia coriiceps]|uniref:Receptor-type tyrosine-protein phosphatase beta-like n=1 Tax=Notothenia coriiceps TaxID=8208 RepID=A0A6I9PUV8_9TELE